MTRARILYWKEIPVQVQVEDGQQTKSVPFDPKFQAAVDAIAMFDGSIATDEYLNSWNWGNWQEFDKTLSAVAEHISNQFNTHFPNDLIQRIRDMHSEGSRKTSPGSIDHWIEIS